MGAPLVGVAPIFAISFMGFGIGKKIQQTSPDEALNPTQLAAAGFLSGFMTTVIMDVVKSRLQAAPDGMYKGALDVLQQTLKNEGVGALWKGAVPVLLRAFPANAACFLGYEAAMFGLNQLAPNL